MQTAIYSTKDFEQAALAQAAEQAGLAFKYIPQALGTDTIHLSAGCEAVAVFAGDDVSAPVLHQLAAQGVRYIAVRAAGYDNVDMEAARTLGIKVANVPAYSPYAIAEHAVALMLALNRKLITAQRQVHDYNFTVGGLVGFDLHGKTAGIIGTGKIGRIMARILHGFGCILLGYDVAEDKALETGYGLQYTDLKTLCTRSDIITLHTCLTPQTKYLIHKGLIREMKPGAMLINTSRGAAVNTADVIDGLESGRIGYYGADVYEHEKGVFFYDRSGRPPADPMLAQLLGLPNVLLTPHQAYATHEALGNIADTTGHNIGCWAKGISSHNEL